MKKTDWQMSEDWATKKTIKHGMKEDWINFTFKIAAKKLEAERKQNGQIYPDR